MINLNEEAFLGKDEKYTMTEETDFLDSYFNAGLEHASELSEAYADASSDLYIALKEGVANSISTFTSFYSACKNIFGAYIVRLNSSMYNQFSSALKSRIREGKKALAKYRKKLTNYSGKDIELTITRYDYSNVFENDIPSLNVFESFKNERQQMDMIITASGDEMKKKTITSEFEKVRDYITSGECYNNARAAILKADEPIEAKDYAKAIFDAYRSGGDQVVDYSITAKQIKEIAERFYTYENCIDTVDRQKKQLFRQYNYILEHLEKYDMFQMKGLTYDNEVLRIYELYTKLKADQLKHYCSLYLNAYDGKLDAIANSYMQDRDILFKVCGYIDADEIKEGE